MLIVGLGFLLLVVIGVLIYLRRSRREGYNIIFGAAGSTPKLRNYYYNCLSQCQRVDPTKSFTSDAGMYCDYKCSNDITLLASKQEAAEACLDQQDPNRRCGTFPYDEKLGEHPPYAMDPKTLIDVPEIAYSTEANEACWAQCGPGREAEACRTWCACEWETKSRCKQECLHAGDPQKCLPVCQQRYSTYCLNPGGYTWKSM